jgi:NADPH:quinone reductase-like Zn-dependent oxidoreductase
MSWSEAAAFPLATLTGWHMLTARARLQAGETVLIWGVGGGVGMAALQIAVLLGARAISPAAPMTSSSRRHDSAPRWG